MSEINEYNKNPLLKLQGEILMELVKAEKKFPWWPEDIIHAVAILQEECGELVKACLRYYYQNGDKKEVKKELLQTGAMVYRFAVGLTQGYPRGKKEKP